MSGALPPGLLLAALGLALAFATPKARLWAVLAAVISMAAALLTPFPADWAEGLFVGCWVSLVATALCVHLPRGVQGWCALALGLNAGIWSGAILSAAGGGPDWMKAMAGLILHPIALQTRRWNGDIAVKTVASWLVAVGILVAALPMLTTPGYVPDHME